MPSLSKSFVRSLYEIIEVRLASLGFARQRTRHGIYRLDLDGDSQGWLGLNDDRGRDAPPMLRINPVIGLHHAGLRSLFNELYPGPREEYGAPIISSPLGYLTPARTFAMWDFEPGGDNEAVADSMIADIRDYGIPFMRSHDTLPKLVEGLANNRYSSKDHRALFLPPAYLLLGNSDEALAFATEELERRMQLPESPYENAQRYVNDYAEFVRHCHEWVRTNDDRGSSSRG